MKARTKGISLALSLIALLAFIGIAIEGRGERRKVVVAVVYGGRLAADGSDAVNAAFAPNDGSAAIGINYRYPSSARWAIDPFRSHANEKRWLYVSAESPEFFSAAGYDRVYVGHELVGEIRALAPTGGEEFAAAPEQQPILMPPARTFGYRFELLDDRSCSRSPCAITIVGAWTFWHVYRFAIIGERARFAAPEIR